MADEPMAVKFMVRLDHAPALMELLDAAAFVVQVSPRSPAVDRLQEAVIALIGPHPPSEARSACLGRHVPERR